MKTTGIEYKNTEESGRGSINGYHSTARMGFKEHHKGAKNTDIAQLKKVQLKNFKLDTSGDFTSKLLLGWKLKKLSYTDWL